MERLNGNQQRSERPRRGRPTGQNRVPLTLEERRARNALYEKERRDETARALAELAREVGVDPDMVQSDLLATVVCFITSRQQSSCQELERINQNLMAQIADCERRLGSGESPEEFLGSAQNEAISEPHNAKRKRDEEEPFVSESRPEKKLCKQCGRVEQAPEEVVPPPQPETQAQLVPSLLAVEHTGELLPQPNNSFGVGFDPGVDSTLDELMLDLNFANDVSIGELIDRYL